MTFTELLDTALYKDEKVAVALRDKVFMPGQLTVFPVEKFTILEMVPEDVLAKCFLLANKVSIAAFESLGSQGTNIIIRNGLGAGQNVSHFGIEVVPRVENDGLNFEWQGKRAILQQIKPEQEEELERTASLIKEALENVKPVEQGDEEEVKEEEEKNNYLLKSLDKIP